MLPDADYVCSVKWVPGDVSSVLAVGLSTGNTMLWNVQEEKKLRTLKGHTDRVSSLSWNEVNANFTTLHCGLLSCILRKSKMSFFSLFV